MVCPGGSCGRRWLTLARAVTPAKRSAEFFCTHREMRATKKSSGRASLLHFVTAGCGGLSNCGYPSPKAVMPGYLTATAAQSAMPLFAICAPCSLLWRASLRSSPIWSLFRFRRGCRQTCRLLLQKRCRRHDWTRSSSSRCDRLARHLQPSGRRCRAVRP